METSANLDFQTQLVAVLKIFEARMQVMYLENNKSMQVMQSKLKSM